MKTVFRLSCYFTLTFLCVAAHADEPSEATRQLQSKIDTLRQQQSELQKQIALKKATIEVEQKRIADLETQIRKAKERSSVATKSLMDAETREQAAAKQAEDIAVQLRQHQAADKLLADAAVVQNQVETAESELESLLKELETTRNSISEQQQNESQATADLKKAQEQLPKVQEQLTAARTALDAAAKQADAAQLVASRAREEVRAKRMAVLPEKARVNKAGAALAQVTSNVKSLEESLAIIRSAAEAAGENPDEAVAELRKSLTVLTQLQQRTTALVNAAQAKASEAQKAADTAVAALTEAQGKLREAQNKYAEQGRAHFKLQLQVADLQGADRIHQKQIADAKAAQEQLAKSQSELAAKIAAATDRTEDLKNQYLAKQKLAESALEPLGRFVSFSKHVAPIFAKRCVACHNTRTASGRLNMASFAALLKGGESGASLEAHKAEDSLLFMVVEDGSMPKDADPLTKEQIDVIRKWIDAGAPLDAGVVATADLFDVMPEMPQPLPPESYRVPIPVTATAFSPDGGLLASSGYHEVLVWNTDDSSLIRRISNVAERVYDLEFSSDGTQLAVAAGTPGQLGEVKLFSVADGSHQKTLVRTRDAVFAVSYSPDGESLVAGGADRVVYVADIASGDIRLKIEDHADWVMDANWSPDGTQLVTASRDKTAKVFSVADGRSVTTFNGHGDAVYSAEFLADGQNVVSAGSDKQARIWKTADGKETRKIGGFGADVFRIEVTPENHLLTACADRNARQHNLGDGKSIRTFAGHKDWVYTLCYNAKRKLVATGSYDGEIRVWNFEDGSMARSFIAIPQGNAKATVAAAEE